MHSYLDLTNEFLIKNALVDVFTMIIEYSFVICVHNCSTIGNLTSLMNKTCVPPATIDEKNEGSQGGGDFP